MSNLQRAIAYLQAIEQRTEPERFFSPDIIQEEFPNRLVPEGARRDLRALREAAERGRRAVSSERYEIVSSLEQGEQVALEVLWSATLAVPLGKLQAGDTLRARFAVFLTFRDGLIVSQRNYDCFEPF